MHSLHLVKVIIHPYPNPQPHPHSNPHAQIATVFQEFAIRSAFKLSNSKKRKKCNFCSRTGWEKQQQEKRKLKNETQRYTYWTTMVWVPLSCLYICICVFVFLCICVFVFVIVFVFLRKAVPDSHVGPPWFWPSYLISGDTFGGSCRCHSWMPTPLSSDLQCALQIHANTNTHKWMPLQYTTM